VTRRSYPAVLVYLSLELGLNITWQVATESLWHRQKYKIQHTICRGWRGGRGGRYTCPSIEPIQIKACFGGVQLHMGAHRFDHTTLAAVAAAWLGATCFEHQGLLRKPGVGLTRGEPCDGRGSPWGWWRPEAAAH
jgi:hypothetical protein